MSDNTTLNPGAGGDIIRTEAIPGGAKICVTKIHTGIEGQDAGPVTVHNPFPVVLGDGTSQDAFGRLRISNPETIHDCKQLLDNQPYVWDDAALSGAGTSSAYSATNACTTIAVSNTTVGARARQTFQRFNYQPGKSQLVMMTLVLAPEGGQAGNTRRVGSFDANNGIFLQLSGTTLGYVERKGAADTVVPQASWNVDPLDGTGPSGITLDVTKTQILFFDMQWLGVGRVRFGFIIGGMFIVAHDSDHANIQSSVYIASPNNPLRYEISNDGSGAVGTLVHICTTVISEGGQEPTGSTYSVDRADTILTTGNDVKFYPLLVLRLQSGKLLSDINPKSLTVISTTANAQFRVIVWLDRPGLFTFAGAALSFNAVTNSTIEYAIPAATNTITFAGAPAHQIYSAYALTNHIGGAFGELASSIKLGAAIDNTAQYLVLAIQPVPANGALGMFGGLVWQEAV